MSVDLDGIELLHLDHVLVLDTIPHRDRDGLYLFGNISGLRIF